MPLWGNNDGTDTGLTVTITTAGNTHTVFSADPSANVKIGDVIVADSDGGGDGPEHRVVTSVQGTTVVVSEGWTAAYAGGTDCWVSSPPKYVSKTDIKNQVIIGADTTETGVSDSVTHAGWLQKHTKSRLGASTTWYETLVASSSISGDEETGGLADS